MEHQIVRSRSRKASLEAKLAELSRESPSREELHIEWQADPTDEATMALDREVTAELLAGHSQLLADVQAALGKVKHGGYGLCEECCKPIPPKRLNAVPWARYCSPCQQELERGVEEPGYAAWHSAA